MLGVNGAKLRKQLAPMKHKMASTALLVEIVDGMTTDVITP